MNPVSPWHMWGTSEVLKPIFDPISGFSLASAVPLARVNYRRPESWNFFFYTKLQGPLLIAPAVVWVMFDIFTGVGRTNIDTKGRDPFPQQAFCLMRYNLAAGIEVNQIYPKYTTSMPGRPLDDSALTLVAPIDTIVGEDITVTVSARTTSSEVISIQATALLAPKTHVRPDWFATIAPNESGVKLSFRGSELGGT